MLLVCKMKVVQEFVKNVDYKFYQHILETLLPNVLRPIPSKNSNMYHRNLVIMKNIFIQGN